MDNYLGYQLMIEELTLPYLQGTDTNIIVNGTFAVTKERRVANEWTDANGHLHRELYEDARTIIRFTIKERTAEQHALLRPLLEINPYDDTPLLVTYWDDESGEYKVGEFYLDNVEAVTSIATQDDIYYGALNITLTEY